MSTRKKIKLLCIGVIILAIFLSGCTTDDKTNEETIDETTEDNGGDAQTKMSFTKILISDAPSENFSHINVTFSEVKVHKSRDGNDSGWIVFTTETKTIDMIYLHVNNLSSELGVKNLTAGNYTKLWIVVDAATGVLKDTGEEVIFDVPSGTLKVQQSFEIKEGNTTIDVELDLDRSVLYVPQGGVYKLTPQLGKMKVSYDENKEKDIEEEPGEEESNLVAHYKFDETSGTTAVDSAGNYNGILNGGTWSLGKFNNSIYLDGVDDYLQLSQNAIDDIGNLTQGTIAFWFNYSSMLDEQTIMPILFIGNEDTANEDSIFIIEIGHSNTKMQALTTDPSNKNIYVTWTDLSQNSDPVLCYDTNENQAENTWVHFALVVGSAGNTGYINGVELEGRRYNFGESSDQMFLSEIPVKELFTIGYGKTHFQISPEFVYYKGYIDDLRIYNEPLIQTQIQDLL